MFASPRESVTQDLAVYICIHIQSYWVCVFVAQLGSWSPRAYRIDMAQGLSYRYAYIYIYSRGVCLLT